MTIPTKLTEAQFKIFVEPFLSKAKRGYVSKIPLYKIFNYILYFLHTGCQWNQLPIRKIIIIRRNENSMFIPVESEEVEISYQAVYYHFRKWSIDGSIKSFFENSVRLIEHELDFSEMNLDGTHTISKKGGQSVKYQGRKKAKTSNIIPVTEKNGFILSTTKILPGNNNDLHEFSNNFKTILKDLKKLNLKEKFQGSHFNADAGFDTRSVRKICFNHGLIPNIPDNTRNRKKKKVGRKRLFNKQIYKNRFVAERSFAWVDKFKRALIRFERLDILFLAVNMIAFAMVNIRFLVNEKV